MGQLFDLFTPEQITLFKLKSTVPGNTQGDEYPTYGIVKIRDGLSQSGNVDNRTADATVHLDGCDEFAQDMGVELSGHLWRHERTGILYRITNTVEGEDYDTGEIDHYSCASKKEAETWASSSPLE